MVNTSIVSLALAGASGAWAQAEAPAATSDHGVLDEVIVTAERRVETVQKTAISITAVSGEEIREKGQATIDSVLRDVPAVQIQGSPQGGQIYIRGVGTNGDNNSIDPAVSLMRDDVYNGRAEAVTGAMYDVARVEVLRGPQGTLYGRNATGGSVNVITNSPTNDFEGVTHLQIGDYNLLHADGAVNLPLGERTAVRVAGMREKRDGYYTNGGGASDATGARLKVLTSPTDTLTVLATVDYLHLGNDGQTTVPRPFTIPRTADGSISPALVWLDDWRTDYGDPWEVDPLHPPQQQDYTFTTASLKLDWDLGWGVATLLPAYSYSRRQVLTDLISGIADTDLDGEPNALQKTDYLEKQHTVEARLSSSADSVIKWVFGLYYLRSDNQSRLAASIAFAEDSDMDFIDNGHFLPTTSKAVFGQATYPLTDAFRLTGGMRYTKDEKSQLVDYQSIVPGGTWNPGPATYRAAADAVTFKAGIEYDLAPESMLYAQVATGYKAGGFSTTAFPPDVYDPEELTAYEIGSKNRFLDSTLQVNGELFLYRYDNYQVQYQAFGAQNVNPDTQTDGDPSNDTMFLQLVANADTGTTYGAELETLYRLTPDDELKFTATYTHARYGDLVEPQLAYASGAPVANTAPWTASLGYEHGWNLANGARLAANVNMKWSDAYDATFQNDLPGNPNIHQDSFTRSDATLTYTPTGKAWSAGAWVRNIEDDAQIVGVLPWGRTLITDPRSFGANLTVRF